MTKPRIDFTDETAKTAEASEVTNKMAGLILAAVATNREDVRVAGRTVLAALAGMTGAVAQATMAATLGSSIQNLPAGARELVARAFAEAVIRMCEYADEDGNKAS